MFPLAYMKLQEVQSLLKCSLHQLLSAIKPVSVLGRAVMALPLFFYSWKINPKGYSRITVELFISIILKPLHSS